MEVEYCVYNTVSPLDENSSDIDLVNLRIYLSRYILLYNFGRQVRVLTVTISKREKKI